MATVDIAELKAALAAFPTGVTIISVFDPSGIPRGMTANAFSSVSLDPPQVLVCVNRSATTHALIVEGGRFGINILSELDAEISRHCARPGSEKRLEPSWLAPNGVSPHLTSASAFLDCRVKALHEAGTHSIVVGLVESAVTRDHSPLVYYRGSYRGLILTETP